jgi:hypothetical protein
MRFKFFTESSFLNSSFVLNFFAVSYIYSLRKRRVCYSLFYYLTRWYDFTKCSFIFFHVDARSQCVLAHRFNDFHMCALYQETDEQFSSHLCISLQQNEMSILSRSTSQVSFRKCSFALLLQCIAHNVKCFAISEIRFWRLKTTSHVWLLRFLSIDAQFARCSLASDFLSSELKSTSINVSCLIIRKIEIDF